DNAFAAMRALEAGAIANPTEKRMVGHYWLRNPALAPTPEIRTEIEETVKRIKTFVADIRGGKITAENGKPFKHVLLIGIGGSALGPQFVSDALDHGVIRQTSCFSTIPIRTGSTASSRSWVMNSCRHSSWWFQNLAEQRKHETECSRPN